MTDLVADCSKCAALCCVAMPFDKGDMFAFDKEAGVACKHLDGHLCKLHGELEDEGLKGCVIYDCVGAGQRVVQEMFGGKSWRDDPEIEADMFEAFRIMRLIHGWLELLEAAVDLPLDADQEDGLEALYARLQLPEEYDLETLIALERSGIGSEISGFLRSLAGTVRR